MNNDYNRSPQEVLEELGSCPTGLTEQQAAERLAKYGPNKLQEAEKATLLQRFLTAAEGSHAADPAGSGGGVRRDRRHSAARASPRCSSSSSWCCSTRCWAWCRRARPRPPSRPCRTMTAATCKVLRGRQTGRY